MFYMKNYTFKITKSLPNRLFSNESDILTPATSRDSQKDSRLLELTVINSTISSSNLRQTQRSMNILSQKNMISLQSK